MKRFWPIPLWLELIAAVLIALLVTNAATGLFFRMAWHGAVEQRFRQDFAERAAHAVAAVLAADNANSRTRLLKAMSGPGQRVSLSSDAAVSEHDRLDANLIDLVRRLEPGLQGHEVRVARETRLPRWRREDYGENENGRPIRFNALAVMTLSARAQDGAWINAEFNLPVPFDPSFPLLFSALVLFAALSGVAFWISRRIVRPLQALESAAKSLGPGDPPAAVPERGPRAVQAAIRAFNAMSQRVSAMLEGQRVVMAAVAHDLRSPITSLRLRAEFVSDSDTKDRMLATLNEMQTMTEAVIDLARLGKSSEASRLVDLRALTESLCEDMAETGDKVTFLGGADARALSRVSEVTRALRNLIENAVRYGGGAQVSLTAQGGDVSIQIDDDGPGVPQDQIEALFTPFARLESSRNMETGGHGLGLTISRMIARGHGGDVTLVNRTPCGLRATLRLPAAPV